MSKSSVLFLLLFSLSIPLAFGQPGPIKFQRYDDDFSHLQADSTVKKGLDKLKYIPLSRKVTGLSLSVGGEIREWYEFRKNVNFGDLPPGMVPDPDGALLHRAMIHADLWAGTQARLFVQFNNTLKIGSPNDPIEEIEQDGLGLHQAFMEFHFSAMPPGKQLFLRAGRQEYSFGNELMISSREGPNNRQNWEGASLIYRNGPQTLTFFGATPLILQPKVFDNEHIPEYMWGVYASNPNLKPGGMDLYYMGFHSSRRLFNFVPGTQTRHTGGVRFWELQKPLTYDVEGMYQLGKFEDLDIQAFNLSAEVKYTFPGKLKPVIGLAGVYISGDRDSTDGQLNTFDPMYPKPTFGLAAPLGPANITNIRPIIGLKPISGLGIYGSVYFMGRQSNQDGTYTPGMQQVRPFSFLGSSTEKFIGRQYALDIFYFPNPHWGFISFISLVEPGKYVQETGAGQTTFFSSLSASYKF